MPHAVQVAGGPTTHRQVLPAMRALLVVFTVLTTLAVVALFVLSEQTDQTFAWTIQPAATAAFLGAGYAAGTTLVLLSLRDRVWADSKVPVLTVLVFTVVTLAATLLHLDRFHFQPEFAGLPLVARAAAWFWTGVYVAIPVLMVVALALQARAPGVDPPPRRPVPGPLRIALAAEAAVLLVVGGSLFAAPSTGGRLWPWALTPLTARVVAAWLIAFGAATAVAAVAGDLDRLRTSTIAYTVFGLLALVTVARYPGAVAWDRPVTWAYVALSGAVLLTGALGWRRAARPDPAVPAPAAGRTL